MTGRRKFLTMIPAVLGGVAALALPSGFPKRGRAIYRNCTLEVPTDTALVSIPADYRGNDTVVFEGCFIKGRHITEAKP